LQPLLGLKVNQMSNMVTLRNALSLIAMVAVVLGAWLAPLDAPATAQVEAGLKRALISFAAARALNGVISVAQGTEVSVQPLGVGVTLAPGQLLDPINDLVEQFSNLMLMASVAFGVQKVLIAIGGYWLISLWASGAAVAWTVWRMRQTRAPPWLTGLLVAGLMLRFAIPVATLGSDMLWQKFLASDYEASQQVIQTATGQVAQMNPPQAEAVNEPGWIDRIKGWVSQNGDVKLRFERLKQAAEQATDHMIKLIVIFLLQTLVIPLGLMWGLLALAKAALRPPFRP
jgi:hypothetical protein